MRPPSQIDDVQWDAFPGPKYFSPADIPKAVRRLASATDAAQAEVAASACLFALGNNSRGTLYPAAPHVVPFLAWIIAHGSATARPASFAVLDDAAWFVGEAEWRTTVDGAGQQVPVERAFRDALRIEIDEMLGAAVDTAVRKIAEQLSATLDEVEE
jgi:hypothetical protein